MSKTHTDFTLEDIYNMIMLDIEPDLATFNIESLTEKYTEETEEEKNKRMKRYTDAFKKCADTFGVCMHTWKKEFLRVRREALGTEEDESDILKQIEGQISRDDV